MARPQLWVIAGPNGAGKSSVVARYRLVDRIPVVNPDVIALELSPEHRGDPVIMLRAGKVAARRRRMLLKAADSFAIETTLDNSQAPHRLLVTIDEGRVRYVSRRLPAWARAMLPKLSGRTA